MTAALTTTGTSSTLAVQIAEVENQLRDPRRDEILSGLRWLMDTGMAYPPTIPEGKRSEAYVAVLSNVPACGLRKVLTKLRNGQYENINLAFIPLPAELAAMSRAEAKTERDDLMRLRETRQTLSDRQSPQPVVSEEGRARVRKLLEAFRADHRAAKEAQRGVVVGDDPSPEQIERWEKIMAMPDAREMTAEQIAHRNSVTAKISKAKHPETVR